MLLPRSANQESGFAAERDLTVGRSLPCGTGQTEEIPLPSILGIYGWPVSWLRDSLFVRSSAGEPRLLCDLNFAKRLIGRLPMRRAEFQVGNVRNPAFVLAVPKQIDVVFAHVSRSKLIRFPPPTSRVVSLGITSRGGCGPAASLASIPTGVGRCDGSR